MTGIYNGVQVGQDQNQHAVAWHGTAASLIDLNPPNFNTYSAADSIWGNEASGEWSNNPNGTNSHAALWTSLSPSGFVDLSQPSFTRSEAFSVSRDRPLGTP